METITRSAIGNLLSGTSWITSHTILYPSHFPYPLSIPPSRSRDQQREAAMCVDLPKGPTAATQ